MSSETSIRVDGVSKRYELYDTPRDRLKQFVMPRVQSRLGLPRREYFREFWALRDISFEVQRGEPVGIVGRNGSGKSTLLQIITGTLSPTQGEVSTQGRIAALLELGTGFNPEFSGRENVFLNAALLGLDPATIEQRFDAIAAFADIGEHLDQPVKTYSSGMLVRLAFAVQVQIEPDILIVDEALAVGDALFQKRCFQRIDQLVANGTTLLFVSHDQESVRTLTRRALLLEHGRSLGYGSSATIILDYRRLLHAEESAYFDSIAQAVQAKAQAQADSTEAVAAVAAINEASPDAAMPERLSFGDGGVQVVSVETLDANGARCAAFYPGDRLIVQVTCRSSIDSDHLNVGVRLRNKEGIKIYSWGTLNQDMEARAHGDDRAQFWQQPVRAGETVVVTLECECRLGANLYEVQAAVSHEATPDYLAQRMLHWVDEAAFFQVVVKQDEHFFGGVVDMNMEARWRVG